MDLSRQLSNPLQEAALLQQLAQIATQKGDFEAALPYAQQALDIATEHGDEQIQAACEWRLGFIAFFSKDLDAATEHYLTSLRLYEKQGDAESGANCHAMLGIITMRQGRLDDARSHLTQSLEIERRYASSRSVANLLETFAALEIEEGQIDRALRLGGAAAGMRNRLAILAESPLSQDITARLDQLRRGLSSDDAWHSGWEMSREDAIAYALNESPRQSGVPFTNKEELSRP